MPEKILQQLNSVSETLLMTLYARARKSQRPDAMIKDEQAGTRACAFWMNGLTTMMTNRA